MMLIGVRLQLAPSGRQSALHGVDFLGGILHGAVEHLVRQQAPDIAAQLGMTGTNRIKPYALLPPPFGWQAQPDGGTLALPFGIALHGPAARHAESLARALQQWREVRCGGSTDHVRAVHLAVSPPGGPTVSWSPEDAFPAFAERAPLTTFPARDALTLRFLTPLLLTSSGRHAAALDDRPPSLLRLVRALRRRVEGANPALFAQLAGPDWVHHEEAIRPLHAHTADWHPVGWRYGSRTKPAPITFHGHLGTLHYRAASAAPNPMPNQIPGPIHALLQWGTWFGAGQRTALGQGMYLLQESAR